MKLRHQQPPQGFTFIDTIVATTVVAMGMVGVFSMLIVAQQNYLTSKSRLTGVMLAQEGVEWARNLRDSNVANGDAWNAGLAEGTYYFEDDTPTTISGSAANDDPIDIAAARMRRTGSHFLHSSGTTPTRWYRIVKIAEINEDGDADVDGLTITSWVQWRVADNIRGHTITAFLYDWR